MNLIHRVFNHFANLIILRLFFCYFLIKGKAKYTVSEDTAAFTLFGSNEFIMGFVSKVLFQQNSGVNCKVFIIDDGTLSTTQKWCLRRVNADVTTTEDNEIVRDQIRHLPNTFKLYQNFILMKKLLDLYVKSRKYRCLIYFDSDVMFTNNCR